MLVKYENDKISKYIWECVAPWVRGFDEEVLEEIRKRRGSLNVKKYRGGVPPVEDAEYYDRIVFDRGANASYSVLTKIVGWTNVYRPKKAEQGGLDV